jgi:hypothetical protein
VALSIVVACSGSTAPVKHAETSSSLDAGALTSEQRDPVSPDAMAQAAPSLPDEAAARRLELVNRFCCERRLVVYLLADRQGGQIASVSSPDVPLSTLELGTHSYALQPVKKQKGLYQAPTQFVRPDFDPLELGPKDPAVWASVVTSAGERHSAVLVEYPSISTKPLPKARPAALDDAASSMHRFCSKLPTIRGTRDMMPPAPRGGRRYISLPRNPGFEWLEQKGTRFPVVSPTERAPHFRVEDVEAGCALAGQGDEPIDMVFVVLDPVS